MTSVKGNPDKPQGLVMFYQENSLFWGIYVITP